MPSPIDILLNQHTPPDVLAGVPQRMRQRRKEQRLSQQELSLKSGVSLGSLKRFEREHQISSESLVKLAFALGCEDDFDGLFSKRGYASIEEVIADAKGTRR